MSDWTPPEAQIGQNWSPPETQQPQGGYWTDNNPRVNSNVDVLGRVAQLGNFANNGNQRLADTSAEALGKAGVNPYAAAIPGTILGTASQFLLPQNRLGAAFTLASPAIQGTKAIANSILDNSATNQPGFIAKLAQGMARLRPSETQYYLDHPEEIMNASSISQAEQGYKEAIGDLQGKTQSIAARLNRRNLSAADYNEAINRADQLVRGTFIDAEGKNVPITPQDALEGIQSINQAMRNKEFTSSMDAGKAQALSEIKSDLMDYMQQNGSPNLRQAATDLFKAHLKESFNSWVPQNKYGSTDALRTWITGSGLVRTLGSSAGAAAIGAPISGAMMAGGALLGAAAVSPKAWGFGINNISALGWPTTQQLLGAAATGYTNLISPTGQRTPSNYSPSPTTPLALERTIRDLANPNK